VPQIGYGEKDKEEFWREMDKVMQGKPREDDTEISGDINEHVGN